MVTININIEKRHLIVFCAVIGILAGMLVAYAYDSDGAGGVPSNFGHSVDEVDWSQTINKNVSIGGATDGRRLWVQSPPGANVLTAAFVNNNKYGVIIGADNNDTYGVVQGRSDTGSGNELLLNPFGGNVGIGTTTPTAKLDVNGIVKSTSGGFRFPDNSVQTTAGVTSVTAGTGLSGGGTGGTVSLSANTNYLQRRVTGSCPVNQAVRVIAADGTVTCTSVPSQCIWNSQTYSDGASCRVSGCNPSAPPGCSGATLAWVQTCVDGEWGNQWCGQCSTSQCP